MVLRCSLFFFLTTTITLNNFHEHSYSELTHVNSALTNDSNSSLLLSSVSIKNLWYILCGSEMRSKTDTGVEQSFHFCGLNQGQDGYKYPIQRIQVSSWSPVSLANICLIGICPKSTVVAKITGFTNKIKKI